MASPTQWTWVWVNSGSWWWTRRLACCSPWGCKELDTTEQLHSLTQARWTFVSKVMSLLFNMLSRLVIALFLRSKHLLISWLQSLSLVILEPRKIKSVTTSTFSPSVCCEVIRLDARILVFWMLVSSQLFHSPLSLSSRGSLVPLYFLPLQWYHPYIWCCWCFSCISQFTSVQCNCSVVSDSLWPHGLQHTRIPCSSPTPGAYSNSCPSSQWYHPLMSSSTVPFSCLQSFPASRSFPMNILDWFPLQLTGLISWQSKGLFQNHSSKE